MNEKEWTIMIYMAGDNNLSIDMAYALEQIKGVAREDGTSPNLLVYYDGNSPEIPTLYCDFSVAGDPKYVASYVVPDKLIDVTKKVNENAADDKSVINFVDWCLNGIEVQTPNGEISYGRRARRYALIFSGHTLGFQDIGLFQDESTGKAMKMDGLFYMLQRLTSTPEQLKEDVAQLDLEKDEYDQETQPLIGQRLDILGFDSCVMGMLEVGYQFSQVARTMIASEGSVPNAGWTYGKLLGCMTQESSDQLDSKKIAERFVREFIKGQESFTLGGVSVDMAAWDLDRMEHLANEFDQLGADLRACFDDPSTRVYKQMERAVLNVHWRCQSYMYDQNVDLGDFCELLDEECRLILEEFGTDLEDLIKYVRESCQKVRAEIQNAVILSGFSGGAYQHSNGVSVFFPWSREGYEVSKKNYRSLFFSKDVARDRQRSWSGFLEKYLKKVALREFVEPTETTNGKHRYYANLPFDRYGPAMSGDEGKLAGDKASKLAGDKTSKLAGDKASKLAGDKTSKLAGDKASKLAGDKTSKLAGDKTSKLAGDRTSKLAGDRTSKMAGGGGGSNQFFDRLQLFKNIESRWNISGFTKKTGTCENKTNESTISDQNEA